MSYEKVGKVLKIRPDSLYACLKRYESRGVIVDARTFHSQNKDTEVNKTFQMYWKATFTQAKVHEFIRNQNLPGKPW